MHPEPKAGGVRRLPLLFLTALAAAFMLVPVAQAAAANHGTVNIIGTGSGGVSSSSAPPPYDAFAGTPPIECTYVAPGPATGVCENTLSSLAAPPVEDPTSRGIPLIASPETGSTFDHWAFSQGEVFGGCDEGTFCFAKTEEGADIEVTAVFCLEGEVVCSGNLTLFVNGPEGSGTVTSSPGEIECEAGEECTSASELDGTATLEADPAAGYVIAGWIGCRQEAGEPAVCNADMSADREVTAIFLKEGVVGAPGSNGTNGKDGTNGTNGAPGAKGDTGATGPQGAQGPAGPEGKVKVTCKVKGSKKVKCTVSGAKASSSRLRWSLMQSGHARSHGKTTPARLQRVLNSLPDGRYMLRVAGQKGTPVRIR